VRPYTASASAARSVQLAGSFRVRSDGMLRSSTRFFEMSCSSQSSRLTSVTLWNHSILPSITAVQCRIDSAGHHASRMLLHVEHVARMAPHARCPPTRSSTICRNSGGSPSPTGSHPRRAPPPQRPPPPPAAPPRCDETRRALASAPHGGRASSSSPLAGVALRRSCVGCDNTRHRDTIPRLRGSWAHGP
jgi:hypothetical protein